MIFIEYSEDICDFATLQLVSLIHFSEPVHTAISLNQFKTRKIFLRFFLY